MLSVHSHKIYVPAIQTASWQAALWGVHQCWLHVQAYQDRLSQLFAGGADILDMKARTELASLVGLKVTIPPANPAYSTCDL